VGRAPGPEANALAGLHFECFGEPNQGSARTAPLPKYVANFRDRRLVGDAPILAQVPQVFAHLAANSVALGAELIL
jgi:hypothetical protein